MVQRDVVANKVGRARTWLNDAEAIFARPPEAFRADIARRDLALFYVFLAIQEAIDLAAHWVADEALGEPDDAGSAFDLLADRNAISRDVASALRGATGLRIRIAHGYALLDYDRVQREANDGIPAIRSFLVTVATRAGL